MSFVYPFAFLYDPGFQMSFVASFALIFFAQEKQGKVSFIKNLIISSSVAYISVLPIALYYGFASSALAIFANLLVLPFVPLAMLFVFLSSVFASGFFGEFFARLADAFLLYIIKVAQIVSRFGQDFMLDAELNAGFALVFYLVTISSLVLYKTLGQKGD